MAGKEAPKYIMAEVTDEKGNEIGRYRLKKKCYSANKIYFYGSNIREVGDKKKTKIGISAVLIEGEM